MPCRINISALQVNVFSQIPVRVKMLRLPNNFNGTFFTGTFVTGTFFFPVKRIVKPLVFQAFQTCINLSKKTDSFQLDQYGAHHLSHPPFLRNNAWNRENSPVSMIFSQMWQSSPVTLSNASRYEAPPIYWKKTCKPRSVHGSLLSSFPAVSSRRLSGSHRSFPDFSARFRTARRSALLCGVLGAVPLVLLWVFHDSVMKGSNDGSAADYNRRFRGEVIFLQVLGNRLGVWFSHFVDFCSDILLSKT